MKVIGVLFLVNIHIGCDGRSDMLPSEDLLVTKNIEYVKKFPRNYTISNADSVFIQDKGAIDLYIKDSLLIITTNNATGFLSLYRLSDLSCKGRYIPLGKDNNNISWPIAARNFTWVTRNGNDYAIIPDYMSQKIKELDFSKMVSTGVSEMTDTITIFSLGDDCISIDENNYLIFHRFNNFCSIERRIASYDGKTWNDSNMKDLSMARIPSGTDMNLINTVKTINKEKKIVVEANAMLNQLSIYSLKNDFGKTICIGDKIQYLSDYAEKDLRQLTKYYSSVCACENFFAALYHNCSMDANKLEPSYRPTLQFFNWQGEPLASIKIDYYLDVFEIDERTGMLYFIDLKTKCLRVADISKTLNFINKR